MPLLTNGDLRSLLRFIKELYTSSSLETFQARVISILPKVISSDLTNCSPINFQKHKLSVASTSRPIDYSQSERDRFILNLLRPHLFQAYQNAQALTQMQQDLVQLNRAVEQLGMIILSGDGEVQLITQRAWALLMQYFQTPSHQKSCLPEHLQRWVKHQISRLTQTRDIPLPCLSLQVEREGKQLIVRLVCNRLEAQYLLLLEEQQTRSFSVSLLELLALTKREAEVLFWVTKNKNNKEIAVILEMSERTVKKHLEHIYQKFGVQSRAAAVTYALEHLGMLS